MTELRLREIAQLHVPHNITLREKDSLSEIAYVPCTSADFEELYQMIYAYLLSCRGKAAEEASDYNDHVFGARDALEFLYLVKHPDRRSYETFYLPAKAAYLCMRAEIAAEKNPA